MFIATQPTYYQTPAYPYVGSPTPASNQNGYYTVTKTQPAVLPAQHSQCNTQQQSPSPTLSPAYLINSVNSPCGLISAPNSNNSANSSDCGSNSSFSLSLNTTTSSPQFSIPTPPPQLVTSPPTQMVSPPSQMMSPPISTYPTLLPNGYVCSPGPMMSYDASALQSAWTIPPQSVSWQPVWVPSPVHQHNIHHGQSHPPQSIPHGFQPMQHSEPAKSRTKSYFPEQKPKTTGKESTRKSRVRCKACSASGCRHGLGREITAEDIQEVSKERTQLLAQLPEFFGEPLLNFEEFVHYSPVFRAESNDKDLMYFKIPRTTKERELNIPRRLNELYVRTFGPEDAPESKSFDRISPHNHLCEARMAIRNSIVKAMQETIFAGCQNMEDGNEIFNLIFRFTGVATVKTITTNLPQVFTAVVTLKNDSADGSSETEEAFECTGVVSLFNYHLFRRKIIKNTAA